MGDNWTKFKLFIILLIFLILIGLLIYGLYYLISASLSIKSNAIFSRSDLIVTKTPITEKIDYNVQTVDTSSGDRDELINNTVKADLLTVPQIETFTLARIKIPILNIDAPIIQDTDGDRALDKGFWLYPGSSVFKGEKILFCHRRFWGKYHPYSCWFLDQLKTNDLITIIDKNNKEMAYKVVSNSVLENSDPGIVSVTTEDIIKIVTCTPLGFSTHRIVVIATRAD